MASLESNASDFITKYNFYVCIVVTTRMWLFN